MRTIKLLMPLLWLTLCATNTSAQTDKQQLEKVENTISLVNNYWQSHNNYATSAFWNWAAYHTGNIEAYKLFTKDIATTASKQKANTWLKFSENWAEHNKWSGATEKDKSKWLYNKYSNGQEYVLFGDWQICFQTYIDLYNIKPNAKRVARAKEVMNYVADSKATDYWWWADALYMVMPTMTKMYKLTAQQKHLDKLYANTLYTDSVMLDAQMGIYFRDGRYVFPKHKAANGGKDFWARGNGWVLAALAKTLQDMPKTYKHYQFFVNKYQRLAQAVAACQQPEGYWTRSMLDKDMAPGPETSGTAFFTYALFWGINNHLLSETDYLPVASKAWTYLSNTALQSDGKVGYVQPIGDRAIPEQTINKDSQADFGVCAFLLASCEYYRWLKSKLEKTPTASIAISNPSATTRQQVVEVDASAVRKALGIANDMPFVVKNALGQELDLQITYDNKLLIDASVLPMGSFTVYASAGCPKAMQSKVYGAVYKMRKDDLAWENDRCAYRAYGPALQRTGEKSFGIDIWVKNTPALVLDQRYNKYYQSKQEAQAIDEEGRKTEAQFLRTNGSFHLDHGDGMDAYSVGATLGCGAPALIDGSRFILPYCYTQHEILDNGPLRFTVRLDFGTNADGITEHRTISLDKGSHFNKVTVHYDGMKTPMTFCAGVVLNANGKEQEGNGWLTYADVTDNPKVHGSEVYVAALFPHNKVNIGKSPDQKNVIGMIADYKGQPITYYTGAAWSRYDIPNFNFWNTYVAEWMNYYQAPLTVTISKQ